MLRVRLFAQLMSKFAPVILIPFISAISSCTQSEKTDSGRHFMSIGTAPLGGAFAVVGDAIAQVVAANAGGLGWQVSSEATKGTQENIRRLVRGELDFGMANAA
ncbi:MAG TPA: TAXI family TRAP transporter solute-binding subunit, partial [bacterium]